MAKRLAALILLASATAAHAADRAAAERLLHTIYGDALYQSELDRIMAEADHKSVFGGAGSAPSARAKDRAMTRDAMLLQREAVLRDASERIAAETKDKDLDPLVQATNHPDAAVDENALAPAVVAVKRGFVEAMWEHLARYARSNSFILCRQGERSFCPSPIRPRVTPAAASALIDTAAK
jgi:hypothetical protein